MSINITGENKIIVVNLPDPVQHDFETTMRRGSAVEVESVTVESPRLPGIVFEPSWVCPDRKKSSPCFRNAGYARQNPSVPRKSGKPESTPRPAPAVIKIASQSRMIRAAFWKGSRSVWSFCMLEVGPKISLGL